MKKFCSVCDEDMEGFQSADKELCKLCYDDIYFPCKHCKKFSCTIIEQEEYNFLTDEYYNKKYFCPKCKKQIKNPH